MGNILTLEDALKRIEELENENAELKKELEYYKNRKMSGRQKHNAKWMAIYKDFVVGYESGMTMVEIAKRNNVSERTIYRYKAYYDKIKEKQNSKGRADIIIEGDTDIYIFEFKLDGSADEALEQIEKCQYALPYLNDSRKIHKIGVNISSETRTVAEWKER